MCILYNEGVNSGNVERGSGHNRKIHVKRAFHRLNLSSTLSPYLQRFAPTTTTSEFDSCNATRHTRISQATKRILAILM